MTNSRFMAWDAKRAMSTGVSVIRQLIHLGLVMQNIAQHSALQLTDAARPVLRGDVPLKLAVPRIVALKPRVMQKSFRR
ncbi:ATP-dependent DNA helicase RecQ [Salmonella enterica subsp. enterica]|nr:ATP-dependent DNA helicase RecQ [Salmonella enterica subsp. enterica]